jgi:methyl-accepting chemotaxis protein
MKEERISFFQSIGGKITLMFVAVVALAIGVVTFLAIRQSSSSLMETQFAQLKAIREIKENQITSYFNENQEDMKVLTETIMSLRQAAFKELRAVHSNKRQAVETYFRNNQVSRSDIAPGSPLDRAMNDIFDNRDGLGETGESYLMEYRNGRYFFRSDMETMGGGDFVFGYDATDIAPEYLQRAVEGKKGAEVFTDSAGDLNMVVYSPVDTGGYNFAMITKMKLEEAIAPTLAGRENDFYTNYINEYGYYDLFLIHPQGEIFYTVAKESDYETNILDGKYADSSLGEAVSEAKETREFAFGDFQPYEPSGGKPASFIAQPIVSQGGIELIVALQMPLEQINAIMQERTGLGETGESYLVGPEKLMRSDSYLDPENHSVEASFANPEAGDVDTAASRAALAGETGAEVIKDYTGHQVLSAYSPVEVYDTEWALLSEINEGEVRAPIESLTTFILISALVMIAVAIAAAVLFSRTISKPINLLVSGANRLAVGDIQLTGINQKDIEGINRRKDELGTIGRAFNSIVEYQEEKSDIAQSIANKDLKVEASASSEQDTLGKSFQEMVYALNDLLSQVNSAVEQVNSGADQVSQASQELSQGATEQASSLEEITSSVNEVNSQSKQNAEHAGEATSLAKQATEDAQKGNDQMKQLKESMDKINASSEEINKVVKLIDDISFQINLLALNANVEAARAGKYGKGFAVVADEVRNLATKSADSVKETTRMVEDTVTNIQEGTQAADNTAQQLEAIVEGSTKVANFLDEISTASREQAQAIDQVTEGLDQIDQTTQSTTASAEESASASEELAGQAQQLRSMVSQFRLDERYQGGQQLLTQGSYLNNLSADQNSSGSGGTSSGRAGQSGGSASSGGAGGNGNARSAAGSAGTARSSQQDRGSGSGNGERQSAGAAGNARSGTGNRQQQSSGASGNASARGSQSASAGGQSSAGRTAQNNRGASGETTGITPRPEEQIQLDDDDFDRF